MLPTRAAHLTPANTRAMPHNTPYHLVVVAAMWTVPKPSRNVSAEPQVARSCLVERCPPTMMTVSISRGGCRHAHNPRPRAVVPGRGRMKG